jgi:hypothetical protein
MPYSKDYPSALTPDERLQELAAIFGQGLLRFFGRGLWTPNPPALRPVARVPEQSRGIRMPMDMFIAETIILTPQHCFRNVSNVSHCPT